ncbi:MAG: trehalase family glycosidase [Patescibacteria group bacterium]
MKLRYRVATIPNRLQFSREITTTVNVNPNFIKLPHYYFVPNDNKFTYIFYWDSYFMFRGLMGTRREWLMREMIENFMYLFHMYQIIPNFNAPASMGRSQPPFFSSMILDTYLSPLNSSNDYVRKGIGRQLYTLTKKNWLKKAMEVAKKEYEIVWIDKIRAYNHSVKDSLLARYGDRDIGYAHSSELESGWDMTSRFYNRCDQFFPIDLNSYLYKYEKDFALAAKILGDDREGEYWQEKARERQKEMHKLMWDPNEAFFYDYNYIAKKIGHYFSLASYVPMWAGLATKYQAKQMVEKLHKFVTPYGLTIGAKESLAHDIDLSKIQQRYHPAIEEIIMPKQWDYPNIWSPLEYLTVIGLLKYGYMEEAKGIMQNAVKAHANVFRKHQTFFEKLNGETGHSGSNAKYEDQQGFGWTNAVFYRYIQLLDALESPEGIYTTPEPNGEPPYDLAILY